MNIKDRVVDGVQFRFLPNSPFLKNPHWVAEQGKPVLLFQPHPDGWSYGERGSTYSPDLRQRWLVYAPLSGQGDGLIKVSGEDAEERAFSIAVGFAQQPV